VLALGPGPREDPTPERSYYFRTNASSLARVSRSPWSPWSATGWGRAAGNTIQICPVGALTSAAYRFRARPSPTQGNWVCVAVSTLSGLIIGASALSSWERMWQCHTETPSVPIVYLPTQTVMVPGGETKVSFGPDPKAPARWNLPTCKGTALNDGATMRVRLLSVRTIVDAKGDVLTRAETVTVFNDLCVLLCAGRPALTRHHLGTDRQKNGRSAFHSRSEHRDGGAAFR